MQEQRVRELICEVGTQLYQRGYVVSNDGNISVRIGVDRLLITPAGVNKARMQPEMMALCDMQGNLVAGNRQPSSEIKIHLEVFGQRPDVAAVVHAHSPVSTAFAVCRRPIARRYLPELLVGIGEVPVAEFAIPSTDQVPLSVRPFIRDHQAVLLANHGILVWSGGLPESPWALENAGELLEKDIWAAFDKLEVVEYAAKMEVQVASMGGGVELEPALIEKLLELRGFYKQRQQVLK